MARKATQKVKPATGNKKYSFPRKITYRKVSGGTAVKWTKKGQQTEGLYLGYKESTYDGKPTFLLRFMGRDKKEFGVWAGAVLKPIMEFAPGTPVRLTFKGVVKKGRKSYNNFEIEAGN